MRRYHFHAYGPNRCVLDRGGAYLDDMIVLRDLAFATARSIASKLSEPGDRRGWRVEVIDQDGRVALVVPFQSASLVLARPRSKPPRTHIFGRPRLIASRTGPARVPTAK